MVCNESRNSASNQFQEKPNTTETNVLLSNFLTENEYFARGTAVFEEIFNRRG